MTLTPISLLERLHDSLEDFDDVQQVFSNEEID